jgi:hypothetical protein
MLYSDDVNLLGDGMNITKNRNFDTSKEVGPEVYEEKKTKYMLMFYHQTGRKVIT